MAKGCAIVGVCGGGGSRSCCGGLVLAALLALGIGVSGSVPAAEDRAAEIAQTRAALEEWVETQRLVAKEKQNLALSRETLEQRIDLVKREIESLRTRIGETQASIAETDGKRTGLAEENEKLKQASASFGDALAALESRMGTLVKRLPDPLRDRVRPLSQRLPDDPAETKLSHSERFQNVVGILNEIDKFNREITVTSEVRTLADGSSAEVATLYLGIGHAFYAGANATVAGIGTAGESGWEWKSADESAERIARAIAILNNEQVASFVPLPVEIE